MANINIKDVEKAFDYIVKLIYHKHARKAEDFLEGRYKSIFDKSILTPEELKDMFTIFARNKRPKTPWMREVVEGLDDSSPINKFHSLLSKHKQRLSQEHNLNDYVKKKIPDIWKSKGILVDYHYRLVLFDNLDDYNKVASAGKHPKGEAEFLAKGLIRKNELKDNRYPHHFKGEIYSKVLALGIARRKMFQGEDVDPEKLIWTWTRKELNEFAPHEPQVGKLVVEGHAIKLPVKVGDDVYSSIEQVRKIKNKKILHKLKRKMGHWNETFGVNIEFYDANKNNISTQVAKIDKDGGFKLEFETETPVEGVKVASPEEHRDGEVNYKLEFLEDTTAYIDLDNEQIIAAEPIITVNDKVKELIKIRDELASRIKDKSRAFSDWRETNVNYREKLIKKITDLLDSLKDSANYGLGSSESEYDKYIEEIRNIHILYHKKTSWEEFINKLSEIINKFWGETI